MSDEQTLLQLIISAIITGAAGPVDQLGAKLGELGVKGAKAGQVTEDALNKIEGAAKDAAGKLKADLATALAKATDEADRHRRATIDQVQAMTQFSNAAQRVYGIVRDEIAGAIAAAGDLSMAMQGLKSITEANGVGFDAAARAAKALTADGLLTMSDAVSGLKNLLARGFNLQEATDLMNRFKDAAAFGRQAGLGFGEAVRGMAEGLKAENPLLLDNGGMTTNNAKLWEQWGKAHGVARDSMTLSQKRMAEYEGIMRETQAQVGDAAKMTQGLAGDQAKLAATTLELSQNVGESFVPTLRDLLAMVIPIIKSSADWVKENKALAATIGSVALVLSGAVAAIGSWLAVAPLATLAWGAMGTAIGAFGLTLGPVVLAVGALVAAFTTDFLGARGYIMKAVLDLATEFKLLGAAVKFVVDVVTLKGVGDSWGALKETAAQIRAEYVKTYDEIQNRGQQMETDEARRNALRKKQADDTARSAKEAEDAARKERLKTLETDLKAGDISKAEYVRRLQIELASDKLTAAERSKLRISLHQVQQQLTTEEAREARQHAAELAKQKRHDHQEQLQQKRDQQITGERVTLALIEVQKLLTAHHLGTGKAAQAFLETLRHSVPVMKALGKTASEMREEFLAATRAAIAAAEAAARARGGAIIIDGQRFSSPSDDDDATYTRDASGGLTKSTGFGDLLNAVQVHDSGGVAAYTGLHWLQKGELTIPVAPVSDFRSVIDFASAPPRLAAGNTTYNNNSNTSSRTTNTNTNTSLNFNGAPLNPTPNMDALMRALNDEIQLQQQSGSTTGYTPY